MLNYQRVLLMNNSHFFSSLAKNDQGEFKKKGPTFEICLKWLMNKCDHPVKTSSILFMPKKSRFPMLWSQIV